MRETAGEHSANLETVVELGLYDVGFHLDVGRQVLFWWHFVASRINAPPRRRRRRRVHFGPFRTNPENNGVDQIVTQRPGWCEKNSI